MCHSTSVDWYEIRSIWNTSPLQYLSEQYQLTKWNASLSERSLIWNISITGSSLWNLSKTKYIYIYIIKGVSYVVVIYITHKESCGISMAYEIWRYLILAIRKWILLVTGAFPKQRASNAENFSLSWRHHGWQEIGFISVPLNRNWNKVAVIVEASYSPFPLIL